MNDKTTKKPSIAIAAAILMVLTISAFVFNMILRASLLQLQEDLTNNSVNALASIGLIPLFMIYLITLGILAVVYLIAMILGVLSLKNYKVLGTVCISIDTVLFITALIFLFLFHFN